MKIREASTAGRISILSSGSKGAALALAASLAVLSLLGCAPSPTATPVRQTEPLQLATPTVTREGPPAGRETPSETLPTLSAAPSSVALPTARAHLYDDVQETDILSSVLAGLGVKQDEDVYDIGGNSDWKAWVNDRDEGVVTSVGESQLIAIVANQVGPNPAKEEAPFGPSNNWIVVLQRQNDKLMTEYRVSLEPVVSPEEGDVRLERTVDVDHDGRDEILVTVETVKEQVLRKDAFLYRWNENALAQVWHGVEQYDNTAGLNQQEYFSYQGVIDFVDVNGDGRDEITVDGERTDYPKNSEGRAEIDHPSTIVTGRLVYYWDGQSFNLDSNLSTPSAQPPIAPP